MLRKVILVLVLVFLFFSISLDGLITIRYMNDMEEFYVRFTYQDYSFYTSLLDITWNDAILFSVIIVILCIDKIRADKALKIATYALMITIGILIISGVVTAYFYSTNPLILPDVLGMNLFVFHNKIIFLIFLIGLIVFSGLLLYKHFKLYPELWIAVTTTVLYAVASYISQGVKYSIFTRSSATPITLVQGSLVSMFVRWPLFILAVIVFTKIIFTSYNKVKS